MDYRKQINLIDAEEVNVPINVIGCGALGSWLVLFLLKMGFKNITVYDFDNIEEHNIPNQCFSESQVGMAKVDAMDSLCKMFNKDAEERVKFVNQKVTLREVWNMEGIILCAVDSMRVRKEIYTHSIKKRDCDLFIEARLSIWGAYVYTLTQNTVFEKYEETLYDDEEAEVSPCGVSQTALPSAVNAASIMIMQMIQWLNGEEPVSRIEYSIPWLEKMSECWVD